MEPVSWRERYSSSRKVTLSSFKSCETESLQPPTLSGSVPAFPLNSLFFEGVQASQRLNERVIQGLAISTQCGTPLLGSHCSRPLCRMSSARARSLANFCLLPSPSPCALLFSLNSYFPEKPTTTREMSQKGPENCIYVCVTGSLCCTVANGQNTVNQL